MSSVAQGMEVISKLRSQPAVADPNEHHSLDGSDVPEEYLHPCCQKELKASRKKNEVMGKLREGDRVRKALEMRRTALGLAGMPENDHDHCHVSSHAWPFARRPWLGTELIDDVVTPCCLSKPCRGVVVAS